jgi:translation initiation factor IF-2
LVKPDPKVIKAQKEALKAPKKPAKPVGPVIDPNLVKMGEITHYFDRIKVCVLKINHGTVLIGDKLTVVGPKTKFVQKIWSMQIESEDVKVAKKGELIGIKIDKPVEPGFIVYK